MNTKICSIAGCDRRHDSRGFCKTHAKLALRQGLISVIQPASIASETPKQRLYRIGWIVTRDGCWEWAGARRSGGYGCLSIGGGRIAVASRVSYEVHHGPIPDGLIVMHSCDNPPCVNPEHLSVGTHRDNTLDMISKGRGNLRRMDGSSRPWFIPVSQKLTADDVRAIRRLRASGTLVGDLADQFGVKRAQIYKIVARQQWRHVS